MHLVIYHLTNLLYFLIIKVKSIILFLLVGILCLFKLIFQRSFRFIAKLSRRYRDFPYALCLHICITFYMINILHQNGTFVSIHEPVSAYHYHPKSIVYISVHSLCCTFYKFGQIYNMYPPLQKNRVVSLLPLKNLYWPITLFSIYTLCTCHSFSLKYPFTRSGQSGLSLNVNINCEFKYCLIQPFFFQITFNAYVIIQYPCLWFASLLSLHTHTHTHTHTRGP